MAEFLSGDFAMWEAPASLKRSIEVILRKELKQSYCEILESAPAAFGKLSWNFRPSLSACSSLAGNRQYITSLSIYYRDMTCFDGLYLKKSRSACSVLWQNIDDSFGPNWARLGHPGSIPGGFQLRQKSVVGQEIMNWKFCNFFMFYKLEILIQVLIEPT